MRALTICQPYAHLIVTPQAELPQFAKAKRVENRTWATDYRGDVLIHAGLSTNFLSPGDRSNFPEMAFGAVVGIARLVDCVGIGWMHGRMLIVDEVEQKYPWLPTHFHAEGPVGWILEDVRRLSEPIPCKGKLGLWKPDRALAEAVNLKILT